MGCLAVMDNQIPVFPPFSNIFFKFLNASYNFMMMHNQKPLVLSIPNHTVSLRTSD